MSRRKDNKSLWSRSAVLHWGITGITNILWYRLKKYLWSLWWQAILINVRQWKSGSGLTSFTFPDWCKNCSVHQLRNVYLDVGNANLELRNVKLERPNVNVELSNGITGFSNRLPYLVFINVLADIFLVFSLLLHHDRLQIKFKICSSLRICC